ncbi:MAG TPA: DNA polymerase I [Clostridiales bacterium]|nr:DNA polymerase I [Clostridiales bacterium]
MKKIMIIDGNSIVSRAFYGIRLLSTKDGIYTNALVGFFNILLKILDEEKPDGLCVCFDLKGKTFRHEFYEEYKAGRKETPNELLMQIPLLKEILDAMGIARCEQEGFEADDLLGSISRACEQEGVTAVLVTGDRDSMQLVGNGTLLRYISTRGGKTETTLYDEWKIQLDFGIEPHQFVDVKALMGDPSDNIPGVPGIGGKTAFALIQQYGSLENIYANLDAPDMKAGVRQKLINGKEKAELSYRLAKINRDLEFGCPISQMKISPPDNDKLYAILSRLEMKSLIARLGLSEPSTNAIAATPTLPLPEAEPVMEYEKALSLLTALSEMGKPVALAGTWGDNSDQKAQWMLSHGEKVYSFSEADFSQEEWAKLDEVIFSECLKKIVFDVKGLYHVRKRKGKDAFGIVFDIMLAGYLLNLGQELSDIATSADVTLPKKAEKALIWECASLVLLEAPLRALLEEQDMVALFEEIELPLARVMADMEVLGFGIDKQALAAFGDELAEGIAKTEAEIFALAGHEFNIQSPKQLGTVLFEELGLPVGKKTKTGYSTNVDVLNRLAPYHAIIPKILEFRSLTKLKSTYVDGLLKQIAKDGRIHSSLNQTGTVTGRISSSEPNLQNIPVRSELGSRLREMFCAGEGKVLIDADYSQIELRVLAHIADDRRMKEAFLNNEDIHSTTAALVFDVPQSEVTYEQRSRAKAVNFGIVYGISDFSLAEDIGASRKEARWIIDRYLDKYEGVKAYMADIVQYAKEHGYVTTLWNRRRYLPDIQSRNFNLRSAAERTALNTPIQGTAADIIKMAMVRVAQRLEAENLSARLILQVHDELIVEAPEQEAERVKKLLTEEMEAAMQLSVRLVAESGVGKTWAEAKG